MQKINCYDENGNTIDHLVQWDKNQVIYAEQLDNSIPNIHYAVPNLFEGSRLYENTVSSSNNKLAIKIPNELLKSNGRLYVYLYYTSTINTNPSTTKYVIELTIKSKPKPNEYVSEDDENWISISQLETRISNLESKTNKANAGSDVQAVYFVDGQPLPCSYTLNKSVPSDAVFTDTIYKHPTTSGNKHIPSGGSSGQVLKWSSNGTAIWDDDNLPSPTSSDNGKIVSVENGVYSLISIVNSEGVKY